MSYQTFKGRSVEDTKRAMRRALGEDAVILSTRRHPDGTIEMRAIQKGRPLFQGEAPAPAPAATTTPPRTGLVSRTARPPEPAPTASAAAAPREPVRERLREEPRRPPPPGLARLEEQRSLAERVEQNAGRNAMQNLRGDLSRKLDRAGDQADPLFHQYREFLGRHAISERMISALAGAGHAATNARNETERLAFALSRVLRFAPLTHSPDAPIMLVGQTGAGKTSSAAKLAARAAGFGSRVAFMSADIGRAGAIEQMTTYAEALDTRFWPIEDPAHVSEILRRERPREQIVLDTPGISPYAPADVAAMRAFREVLGAEPILVIPASGDVGEHTDWVQAFADVGVRRCIITKFDTSRRIGAALSACFEAGMALAHLSEAPFIADGLVDANPDYLAHRLLMAEPGRLATRR